MRAFHSPLRRSSTHLMYPLLERRSAMGVQVISPLVASYSILTVIIHRLAKRRKTA